VLDEIASGDFERRSQSTGAEDVHGLIDERVRELAGHAGERLHAGRSRNDQVATVLLLYARERASHCASLASDIAAQLIERAEAELDSETALAGMTHWQPAQPVLLAFVLAAWTEPFVRAARRFRHVVDDAMRFCPLGSAALCGSTLPLDRERSAQALGFSAPSPNALDAIGNRDVALDLAHACVRAVVDASRISEELVLWATPSFGYVRLGDAASTGSSLMPQKRNPDPFELVRARAATLVGLYAGALGTLCGLATSYHRDLQETKAATIAIAEQGGAALAAFRRAIDAVEFNGDTMTAKAADGYTLATDLADTLIADGVGARTAHATVGGAVLLAETEGRPLDTVFDVHGSIKAKCTSGSTAPTEVRKHLDALRAQL
jgi:argininosuccinate lyase